MNRRIWTAYLACLSTAVAIAAVIEALDLTGIARWALALSALAVFVALTLPRLMLGSTDDRHGPMR